MKKLSAFACGILFAASAVVSAQAPGGATAPAPAAPTTGFRADFLAQNLLIETNLIHGAHLAGVQRPAYDRSQVTPGIVHLGIGAFQRAHQAMYTEAALMAGDSRWGIVGASLRSPAVRDQLKPQDGLYTLAVRDAEGEKFSSGDNTCFALCDNRSRQ